jgi:hypothetical protein
MKRVILDLGVVILFTAEYFCEQAVAAGEASWIGFVIFNPLLMFVGIASLAGLIRGIAEQRMFVSPTILWVGITEWIFLVLISYTFTCFLDVMRHRSENFITVFGFNLFILLVPALAVSTGIYAAMRSFTASRTPD